MKAPGHARVWKIHKVCCSQCMAISVQLPSPIVQCQILHLKGNVSQWTKSKSCADCKKTAVCMFIECSTQHGWSIAKGTNPKVSLYSRQEIPQVSKKSCKNFHIYTVWRSSQNWNTVDAWNNSSNVCIVVCLHWFADWRIKVHGLSYPGFHLTCCHDISSLMLHNI